MKTEISKSDIDLKELFSNEKAIISIIKHALSCNPKIIVSNQTDSAYIINYMGNYKQLGIKRIGEIYYVETVSLQKVNSNHTARLKLKLIASGDSYTLECTSVGFDKLFTNELKTNILNTVSLYLNTGKCDEGYIENEDKKRENKRLLNSVKRNICLVVCAVLSATFAMLVLTQSEDIFEIALVFIVFAFVASFVLTKTVTKSWIDKGFISYD